MKIITGQTYSQVYRDILRLLDTHYEHLSGPRGLQTKEVIDLIATINNPLENLFECEARPFPKRYLAGELIWYFMGDDSLEFIQKFSKFWKRIAREDGHINSAYGKLLFSSVPSQWKWAYDSLIRDPDSRQAIMHFNNSSHQYDDNKDFVCTMHGQFFIREGKLDFTIHMRSSDAIRGITFDFPFFMLLQQQMWLLLRKYGSNFCDPKLANLELGHFRFIAGSCHIYEEHFELVRDMLAAGIKQDRLPAIDSENHLIDQFGDAAYPLERMYHEIKRDLDMVNPPNDPLLKWIYENARKN